MDSTTDSSSQAPGPSGSPPSPFSEDKRKTHIRFLVSSLEAGCIIGKGGSTIRELQALSRARIQVSRNQEVFPGRTERISLITGAFDQVLKAMELIVEKLLLMIDDDSYAISRFNIRLAVPNSCCGGLIGKDGIIIKSFVEDSQASINISPLNPNFIGLDDRIVTLSGPLKEQTRAADLILSKLAEDPFYPQSGNLLYPYGGKPVLSPDNKISYESNGVAQRHSNNKPIPTTPSTVTDGGLENSVTIGIADEHIGVVIGRGGRNLYEVFQATGARIKVSDKGDFITGTSDRRVTITGSVGAIETAELMITNRISSLQLQDDNIIHTANSESRHTTEN